MGDCKPPLADIRNCVHGRRGTPVDENGDPRCQCESDEGWWRTTVAMGEPRNSLSYQPRAKAGGYYVHTRKWESKSSNRRHTLRIDESILNALRGEKNDLGIPTVGRPKHGGRTGRQDRKKRRRGRPAQGNAHLMRAQTLRMMKEDIEVIAKLLEMARDWKPRKKKSVVLYMPNMELAMEELLVELNGIVRCRSCDRRVEMKVRVKCPYCGEEDKKKFKKGFGGHPLLSRKHAQSGWAPTLCRLIEIRAIFVKKAREEMLAQERLFEPEKPYYETEEDELYKELEPGAFPSPRTSKD